MDIEFKATIERNPAKGVFREAEDILIRENELKPYLLCLKNKNSYMELTSNSGMVMCDKGEIIKDIELPGKPKTLNNPSNSPKKTQNRLKSA